ncbi:hypothetical protein GCM10009830_13560 [Glycomyces endophyticus]|uniref:Uncharacterized protein n=1 Tax=Glycomyces endophyticus TaxID=480996 RepID=A0ABP4S8M8_9ACTN
MGAGCPVGVRGTTARGLSVGISQSCQQRARVESRSGARHTEWAAHHPEAGPDRAYGAVPAAPPFVIVRGT